MPLLLVNMTSRGRNTCLSACQRCFLQAPQPEEMTPTTLVLMWTKPDTIILLPLSAVVAMPTETVVAMDILDVPDWNSFSWVNVAI